MSTHYRCKNGDGTLRSQSRNQRLLATKVAAIERVEDGVDAVKELLSTLTIDECCGVMLEFEDLDPNKFAQLVADAPDWVEWMA
ncbi:MULTISPECIES: hypothetical protein [Nostoc]|uniref:hypothetical protein n=1 Tax=Nostoc TaxID=1177 RepID=UPI0036F25519